MTREKSRGIPLEKQASGNQISVNPSNTAFLCIENARETGR
jgi:hypothetical protein